MNLDERQYERIARFIDGERVDLEPAQREVADEIVRLELETLDSLQISVPDTTMYLAREAMLKELRKSRRTRAFGRSVSRLVGLAAAAVVLLVFGLQWVNKDAPSRGGMTALSEDIEDVTYFALVHRIDDDIAFSMLQDELELFEAELIASSRGAMDLQMDAVQDQIDTFWLDDTGLNLWYGGQG